ncbi:membrane-bound O-acyltransferase family protein [Pseudorhodoferax aquiterrae]|uniref:Probable alginate O-acetylase AlgI n=1 Tax=Pseudorhodoferax aquiterrae TaxID=747304 RepID=A0ABQ3GDM5_9BURK|nr:MBOAT family protein [Pseudorhodoferax aquiterrae]GHD01582.1 membrane-bound O-acyltransferase family protein [Pseudorhodoferax aquiterrae]
MTFQSAGFFVFALVAWCACFWAGPRVGARKNILLVANYYFYMAWDVQFAAILLLLTLVNFRAGTALARCRHSGAGHPRLVLAVAVGISLLTLCFFKYADFFVEELAHLLTQFGLPGEQQLLRVVLPIGISFYTFQSLSYVLDVYRGKIDATHSLRDFALFVSFFPTVLSGPISRAAQLLPQIERGGNITGPACEDGLFLVVRGFAKKIIFADALASQIVDPAFASPHGYSTWFLVMAVYAYGFQIYMDLSGYTDIARGVAKIFGFELMENFNRPYAARSISEFWQRWHISMSSFFRDYLYFAVGGSKYGNVYLNLLITFVAIGIWHGAGWNFALYGLIHGLVVGYERYRRNSGAVAGFSPLAVVWSIVLTFSIVSFSRILFRADGLSSAVEFVSALFSGGGTTPALPMQACVLLVLAALLHAVPDRLEAGLRRSVLAWPRLLKVGALVGCFYLLLAIQSGSGGFIYFNF